MISLIYYLIIDYIVLSHSCKSDNYPLAKNPGIINIFEIKIVIIFYLLNFQKATVNIDTLCNDEYFKRNNLSNWLLFMGLLLYFSSEKLSK